MLMQWRDAGLHLLREEAVEIGLETEGATGIRFVSRCVQRPPQPEPGARRDA